MEKKFIRYNNQMSVTSKKGSDKAYICFGNDSEATAFEMPVWAATDLAMLIFKNIGPFRFIKERIRLMVSRRKGK